MAEIIFDDSVSITNVISNSEGRGRIARDFDGTAPFCGAFDLPEIPESEWAPRIKEMTETQSLLSDIRKLKGVPSLNQQQTNYCWGHGPTTAHLLVRMINNQPYLVLSATAVCAQITNYRNVGGWGAQALAFIVQNGQPTTAFWPANEINRKYATQDMKDNAALHKVEEWYDLKPRNFNQLMTCLLLRIPVAVGYNWWSHEVCAIDPVLVGSNTYGIRIWNSWGDSWSENGMGILTGSKMIPDDAVAPRVVTISDNRQKALGLAV